MKDLNRPLRLSPAAKLVEIAGAIRKVRDVIAEALVVKMLTDRGRRRQYLGLQRKPLEVVGAGLDPGCILIGRSDDEDALISTSRGANASGGRPDTRRSTARLCID